MPRKGRLFYSENKDDISRSKILQKEFVDRYCLEMTDREDPLFKFWEEKIVPSCLNTTSSSGKLECVFCAKNFKITSTMTRHYREQHFNEIPEGIFGANIIFQCEICDLKFGRRSHLEKHQESYAHIEKNKIRDKKREIICVDKTSDSEMRPETKKIKLIIEELVSPATAIDIINRKSSFSSSDEFYKDDTVTSKSFGKASECQEHVRDWFDEWTESETITSTNINDKSTKLSCLKNEWKDDEEKNKNLCNEEFLLFKNEPIDYETVSEAVTSKTLRLSYSTEWLAYNWEEHGRQTHDPNLCEYGCILCKNVQEENGSEYEWTDAQPHNWYVECQEETDQKEVDCDSVLEPTLVNTRARPSLWTHSDLSGCSQKTFIAECSQKTIVDLFDAEYQRISRDTEENELFSTPESPFETEKCNKKSYNLDEALGEFKRVSNDCSKLSKSRSLHVERKGRELVRALSDYMMSNLSFEEV